MICACQHDCACFLEEQRFAGGQVPLPLGRFENLSVYIETELSQYLKSGVWNSYADEDFGRMLAAWCALLGDNLSTYVAERHKELYLSSARLETSLREISAQIGFEPNPAISSQAELALTTAHVAPKTLHSGAAFASEGYDGIPSSDFELLFDANIDPDLNRWDVASIYQTVFDNEFLNLDPRTINMRAGEPIILSKGDEHIGILAPEPETGQFASGENYNELVIENDLVLAYLEAWNGAPLGSIQIRGFRADIDAITKESGKIVVPSLLPQIREGDLVAAVVGEVVYWGNVSEIKYQIRVEGTDEQAIRIPQTMLTLDQIVPNNKNVKLYYSANTAGRLKGFPKLRVSAYEFASEVPLKTRLKPKTPEPVGGFVLKDAQDRTLRVEGHLEINAATGRSSIIVSKSEGATELEFPISVFGNLVTVYQGKRAHQNLGQAQGGSFQRFRLGKKPLSFDFADGEVQPDIQIFVDGVEWNLRKSLYGAMPKDRIFVLRADEEGYHHVMFGGSTLGREPALGAEIVAEYRHGADGENIDALRINQSRADGSKIREVFNPFRAIGGVKPNPADDIHNLAPLHLAAGDRVVSPSDFEYAARNLGARGAIAYKEWDQKYRSQRVQVLAIFPPDSGSLESLASTLRKNLSQMAEDGLLISVAAAVPMNVAISLDVQVQKDSNPEHVKTAVEEALIKPYQGVLSLEKVKIGHRYTRSEILAPLAFLNGIEAVESLAFDSDTVRNSVSLSANQYLAPQIQIEVFR